MNALILLLIPISGLFISKVDVNYQSKTYEQTCKEIKQGLSTKDSSELKDYFITSFYHKIFPYWKGTKWDYEGYTNTPKKGVIACGYFVSTPLKHMGLKWNRYKLAQMYASKATDAICDSIHRFTKLESFYKYVQSCEDNIFHVGLSFHVGLVVKYKGKIRFLHSDYINSDGVKEEEIFKSEALKASSIYYVGRLTNPTLLEKWKTGKEIELE